MESPSANHSVTQTGLQKRLAEVERLLASDPVRADALAAECLETSPGNSMALLFQGIARRLGGNPAGSVAVLRPLCLDVPDAPLPHLQLGLALRETGDRDAALDAMRRAVAAREDFGDAWFALADLLTEMGNKADADRAFTRYVQHSLNDPRVVEPATALRENRVADAESMLRDQLERYPNDIAALCMLADVATRQARLDDAEALLARCLDLAPGYSAARHNHAVVLMRQSRSAEALAEADRLLASEPRNVATRNLRAAILVRLAEYDRAIDVYRELLREQPAQPTVWASLGHTLRTVGKLDECIDAYRKAIAHAPQLGEAYWNLANLKTYRIADDELAAMRAQLAKPALDAEDRIHLHFAVGKALEDRAEYADSFQQYAEGNRLRRRKIHYASDDISAHVSRSKTLFDRGFFKARSGYGQPGIDPIFVVGLPRAGSTLVEQILASHSAVEGTMELPHITGIAKSLLDRQASDQTMQYPDVLASLSQDECRQIGRVYLERLASQRKRGVVHFIDKMPNNFLHIGLIHLILPEARIIDVRRHPLACGWSLFRHLFAHGQYFSYSLEDIGRYYRDYVELMAHFDAVLPGRVHRLIYEELVDDTESQVRRLLAHCGLPFESACLEFHKTERAVSTPSSEQVRSPIFRKGLEHWRHFEPWLGPLAAPLAGLAERYAKA